jgi:hypothetical protein
MAFLIIFFLLDLMHTFVKETVRAERLVADFNNGTSGTDTRPKRLSINSTARKVEQWACQKPKTHLKIDNHLGYITIPTLPEALAKWWGLK